ncbi:MAG: flagellar hook-length control protein FliK [Deltaproteobacteria bacterium]|nr:flagellar hook-length control protein FliK [Deltaproteobacteria bacterium]
MSDRVEERRTQEVIDQKKLQNQKTEKEKEAAAVKFKATFASKNTQTQKNEAQTKNQQQQKSFNQNLLMSRQGIAGRTQAERLVKNRDDDTKTDRDTTTSREKDLSTDSEKREMDSVESKEDAIQQTQAEQRFDAPVQKDDDKQKDQQGQGQSQQQPGQQQSGQQGQQQDKRDDEKTVGGLGGAAKAGGAGSSTKTDNAQNAGKVAIGKTMRAAAGERIPQPVMQKLVDQVAVMSTQGMNEFQIQLKDDALGGGSLRVTIDKDKKLKIAFTMKDKNAKNLLDSSKGLFMRMFEKKGMKLESFEVKVRGEA